MYWWIMLLLIFGGFVALLSVGVPVAFAFNFINLLAAFLLWGGDVGQLILSIFKSVTSFSYLPIPLFILMGEVMFQTGVASQMMDVIDTWLGRLPGRLSLLAVAAGVIFATMTGSSIAGVAMLGSLLVPEMVKRGYKLEMTLGPILASGGLAMMIPPSALGVLLASLAGISVGKLLIAIIGPGLLMALLYAVYIIIRCLFNPEVAPPYDVEHIPMRRKLALTTYYVLPQGFIIFLVIGLMLLGIATPTEAAAFGTLGSFLLAYLYGKLNWQTFKKSLEGTMQITFMVFMILTGSSAFAEILAYTGASRGLVEFITGVNLPPLLVVLLMQVLILLMGCFMESLSILMVTLPIFMPIIEALGINPLWFGAMTLVSIETGLITPPFGMSLFTMQGVAPAGVKLGEIYRASIPYILLNIVAIVLILAIPAIPLWLPGLMR